MSAETSDGMRRILCSRKQFSHQVGNKKLRVGKGWALEAVTPTVQSHGAWWDSDRVHVSYEILGGGIQKCPRFPSLEYSSLGWRTGCPPMLSCSWSLCHRQKDSSVVVYTFIIVIFIIPALIRLDLKCFCFLILSCIAFKTHFSAAWFN